KPDTDGTYSIMATVQDEAGYITLLTLGTYEVKNKALEIASITSSKGTTIKNGEPTEITINAEGGKGSYTYELYYSLYGSGRLYYILNGTSANKGTFTPNYPQEWILYAKITDEAGNTATKQIRITSKDITSNITTIYYKGYDNPYIHYQIGNGSWTNAPGVKMTACTDVSGYYYKAEIDLGEATTLTACFNDGNGSWDSNGGQNYSFGTGNYTYSNGVITKIDEPSPISISSSAGDVIKTNTETTLKVNVKGGTNVGYTISVNGTKILANSSSNSVTWKPTKAGIYKISAVATSGSETITAEKTITVKDVTSNITTIYYKGYDNPYIHYQIGNGSWTNAPGVKMTSCTDVSGYYYKAEIDLGDATTLTACFNNGNGSWDSNNGNNYSFGVGSYTYSNGVITKINN
ncbi:MAG: hypothetical protein GX275_03575, partial [Clostridiales bacterium]|nr:hypothetical protein [Clostridiales bacterium]